MILTITDWAGDRISLEPRVELYSVRDFMGKELPGLAIVLDEVSSTPEEAEEYAVLTVSFGEFISLKMGHISTPTTATLLASCSSKALQKTQDSAGTAVSASIPSGGSRKSS